MKSLGIVRRIDDLGRIVIPIELREKFEIVEKDPLEIYTDGKSIILKKFENTCSFCRSDKRLKEFENKLVCEKCINKLKII